MKRLLAVTVVLGAIGLGCDGDGSAILTRPDPAIGGPQTPAAPDGAWLGTTALPGMAVGDGGLGVTVAAITAAEGDAVIPQTVLHLRAEAPGGAADPVVSWSWQATQPDGAVSLFLPSALDANPTFEVDVAGLYDLAVHMRTASGADHTARLMVVVRPDSALHVELLWHTPGDLDEWDTGMTLNGDSLGADLDLHLARTSPEAIDAGGEPPWFSDVDDCYWLAQGPSWDGSVPGNNPSLDRDDTDGAGPENINVDAVDPGACYAIGVHYWDDWGYGGSTATVRVYIMGELAYEAETPLVNHDLWLVGWLCSAEGRVTPTADCDATGCRPHVTSNYAVPLGAGFPFAPTPPR